MRHDQGEVSGSSMSQVQGTGNVYETISLFAMLVSAALLAAVIAVAIF